jgi:hypothetical protein
VAYARAQLGPLNTELGTGDLRIRAAITVSLRVWWLERDHGPAEQVGLVHVGDRPMQTVCEQGFPARDFLPQIILGRGKRAGDDCAQLRKRMTAVIGEAPRQASSAAGAEGARSAVPLQAPRTTCVAAGSTLAEPPDRHASRVLPCSGLYGVKLQLIATPGARCLA